MTAPSVFRPDWQTRVLIEQSELQERLGKLRAFFQTLAFLKLSAAERARLRSQARFMDGYAAMLEERIQAWETEPMGQQVTLTDEEIRMLASGLACEAWARDHTTPDPGAPIGPLVDAMRLCQRLEALIPGERPQCWPDDVVAGSKL